MRRLDLILPLLFLAASGCTAPSEGPAAPAADGLDPGSSFAANGLAAISFEKCTGGSVGVAVPADWVRDEVPRDFVFVGLAGEAHVAVEWFRCPRVVGPTQVVEDVAFLAVLVAVDAVDPSREEGGLSFYALDFLVSNQSVQEALAPTGLAAKEARFTASNLSGPVAAEEAWTFVTDGGTYRLGFSHASTETGRTRETQTPQLFHLWRAADTDLVRVDLRSSWITYDLMGLGSILLETDGSTGLEGIWDPTYLVGFPKFYAESESSIQLTAKTFPISEAK